MTDALERLRAAADRVRGGWLTPQWRDKHDKDIAGFGELALQPGVRRTVRTRLELPEFVHGIDLAGDQLELTVTSIYPVEVVIDGDIRIAESVPMVATGPALIEAVKEIRPGQTVEVEATISPAHGQSGDWVTWLGFGFSTPRLRDRFHALDLAWAQLTLARECAATAAEHAAVEAAAALVPDDPIEWDTGVLTAALAPVADRIAAIDVHVIGHSHIDLAWLWTWDDSREVIKRDIRSALAIMRDYPEVTFTHSQPASYEVIRREEPELFTEIVQHVRAGRWEPATTQWVEGDTNLASGEAMANQLLEGVTYTREHLGVRPRIFHAPDTFGHSANLPQLAADAGARIYYHHRCNPGAPTERWPAYWWEGIDGTRIFACSTASYNGELTAGAIALAAAEAARAGLTAALLFVGVGDHGGGPTRHGYDRLRQLADAPLMAPARCSSLSSYADQIIASDIELPVHVGESATIFEGCYTTHVDAKQTNRDGENRLATAETLTALAGLPRDTGLTQAWRDVCFHQFHDIIDGSAIAEAYVKTREDHARVVALTDAVVDRALAALVGPGDDVVVVNPHGHECTDVVAPDVGSPFVATVPAYGVVTCRAGDSAQSGLTVDAGERYLRIETPHFSVAVRRDCGVLTSFVDKRVGTELVAYGMQRMSDYGDTARPDLGLNVFQLVDERPHFMSSWQFQEVAAEHSLVDGATTEVIEEGPTRVVLQVTHEIRASRIVEEIVFYRDLPRVDFVARVDWQEPAGDEHGVPNLKVSFAPDIDAPEAWFEAPYGAVRRRANGQQVPALRWADVGGADYGVAVLNDSTYGHDVLGNRIRLTLVRTAYAPDPRSDQGEYTFRFAFVPHVGDWRSAGVPHLATSFNQPLLVRRGATSDSPAWQPIIEAAHGLVTTALRVARSGNGVVLRVAEAAGRRTPVVIRDLPTTARVWSADLAEHRRVVVGVGAECSLTLRPWEVRTLVIEVDR